MLTRRLAWSALPFLVVCCVGCGGSRADSSSAAPAATAAPAAAPPAAPKGPIDVCGIVTSDKATNVLGSLSPQPPAKTDNAGFGTYSCLYIGPAVSGEGAQTVFARLTVQAATGKDGPDLMQADVDKHKATIDVPGVGSAAKRNEAGTFVWATADGVGCTAELSLLPNGLGADAAASKLAGLCRDIFAAAR